MPLPYPRPIPPQISAVLGDDELVDVDHVAGWASRARPKRPGRAVLVLHARPPEERALAHELERLAWLDGRVGAPELIATGRAEEGDELAMVRMPVGALPAHRPDHGFDPATVAALLGVMVRDVHRLDDDMAPAAPSIEELRREAAHRVAHGLVSDPPEGPYHGRSPERLLVTLDTLIEQLGPVPEVVIHGGPSVDNLWIAPDRTGLLTGWSRAGRGDPHRDLAVASRSLNQAFGPAAVPPFLDAYGLDDVDLRRLDAHQLLDHLLT